MYSQMTTIMVFCADFDLHFWIGQKVQFKKKGLGVTYNEGHFKNILGDLLRIKSSLLLNVVVDY